MVKFTKVGVNNIPVWQEVIDMAVITIPDKIIHIPDIAPGETREYKLLNLPVENISARLRECDGRIAEFEQAWNASLLDEPFSYPMERDYTDFREG